MSVFDKPEVLKRPLKDVILKLKGLQVNRILEFPFLTMPDVMRVKDLLRVLKSIGCLISSNISDEDEGNITTLGSNVAKLPLGVQYAKIMTMGAHKQVLPHMVVIVTVFSEKSPFVLQGPMLIKTDHTEESEEEKPPS